MAQVQFKKLTRLVNTLNNRIVGRLRTRADIQHTVVFHNKRTSPPLAPYNYSIALGYSCLLPRRRTW